MKKTSLSRILGLTLPVILLCSAHLTAQDKIVYHIPIYGDINSRVSSKIGRVIQDAESTNADAIILEINTFGGELEAATQIRDYLLDSKILTIVFVNKRAISAGALISLAAETIVMAPAATIGAATPVNFLGEKASEKVISYWRTEMKSTAERYDRSPEIAEAMVDDEVEITGLIEKGKLLTLTTREALEYKVADVELETLDDILGFFDLNEAQIVSSSASSDNLFLKPEFIWFVIGFVFLILEFANPGFITFFFGIGAWIVAVICLITDISINTQLVIFIISSVILIVSLRKWLRNIFIGRVSSERVKGKMPEEYLGQTAIVTQRITPDLNGRVEFHGSSWNAESDEIIPERSPVEIVGKDNITLKVKSTTGR